jgi:hypothetical protein
MTEYADPFLTAEERVLDIYLTSLIPESCVTIIIGSAAAPDNAAVAGAYGPQTGDLAPKTFCR